MGFLLSLHCVEKVHLNARQLMSKFLNVSVFLSASFSAYTQHGEEQEDSANRYADVSRNRNYEAGRRYEGYQSARGKQGYYMGRVGSQDLHYFVKKPTHPIHTHTPSLAKSCGSFIILLGRVRKTGRGIGVSHAQVESIQTQQVSQG